MGPMVPSTLWLLCRHREVEHPHTLGVERMMWWTDLLQPATSRRNSQAVVEQDVEAIPTEERDMVAGNTTRV